jgi:spermidine/putrescine transport system ATP-binding protein
VLLLDEPLGALDLKLRKQMQVELKRIQTEVEITFVYVTHDQEEAMTMSNRIAVMRAGRIEQLGSPEDLYERPATAFVAGFLGVSNLLPGKVAAADGQMAEVDLAAGSRVRVLGNGIAAGDEVRVGVRPEKVNIVVPADGSDAGGPRTNVIEGTVADASYLGVSTQYTVRLADGASVAVYSQNTETSGATAHISHGERVRLSWRPEHSFVIKSGAVPDAVQAATQGGVSDA